MKDLFKHTNSTWVRYSDYEWKKAKDGQLYLRPKPKAMPDIYDPLTERDQLVLEAVRIGRMGLSHKPDTQIQDAILQFTKKYGLLGFMTALPTTPKFMDYETVYFPTNHFLRGGEMASLEYLDHFYPFEKLDIIHRGPNVSWSVEGDNTMIALVMTMGDRPMAVQMCFHRYYSEPYEWLRQQFVDWAFTACTSFFFYHEHDMLDDESQIRMRQSMAAFGGNVPTYHIELHDKPTIVWDFNSLLLGIQMMFSFMLTDDKEPLRLCKQCMSPFIASRPSAVFCSPKCKNQYNVYKSRAKKNTLGEIDDNM